MKILMLIKRINEAQTTIVPGNAFGNAGEGFVRLSYASVQEKIEEEMKHSDEESKKI